MLTSLFQSTADPGSGDFSREELRASVGKLAKELRAPAARYLRSARMFLAWMESTQDKLESRFRVPGGSAVNSDGLYYWRLDTADYVEHYGVELPAEFVEHARANDWTPPTIDDVRFLEIYAEIEHIMRNYSSGQENTLTTFYPSSKPR